MNGNVMYADEKSIVGLWANYVLADVGVDESVVVFDTNGTGFIHYTQIDFDIIETFNWKMDGTYLSVKGLEMFTKDKGVLKKVGQSTVVVENIQVHFTKSESIQGSEVNTIQFTEPLDWICDENDVFGLLYTSTDTDYQNYLKRFSKFTKKEMLILNNEVMADELIYMREDLEKALLTRFPWLEGLDLDTGVKNGEIVTCWVGVGWYDLLFNMFVEIENLYKSKNESIESMSLNKIEEKHGLLRVNMNRGIGGVHEILNKYEALSEYVCEVCGEKGELRDEGWTVVVCDNCLENQSKES